ncbi:F-BAR domain only protein 1-like [Acipenser ruthenus]|uniref:F-BAR domain only protein 1-like n=1 Tax=Acipenser ruthenus TaxID=7906 RepID=UPI0027410868|nr:F-BAR domain only protein 1-like [Acipenser ruthenus]
MSCFRENFWGERNAGFDVLYHNMKHGQISTKELAEFVRERAAVEESYSKSMSKLSKMASSSSQLGTFAPMWDLFRVSSDKLALCHLELTRKLSDLIREINKYGDEQVKVHRKTKEEVTGTLEAVQSMQVSSSHLHKARESYLSRCLEHERLRKEGANQKEVEKAEAKSKKAAETFSACVEKYNRVGGDFERKMSESAQKFQEIEEAHLRQMKVLIKSYSHSIEDTHVQVGQVHEEFKQNVENIGVDNLIQKFSDQKGTGRDRPGSTTAAACIAAHHARAPAPGSFEESSVSSLQEGIKKIRNKTFRIPGLSKKEKEPNSTDSAAADTPNSPEVDEDGFVIRADVNRNDILHDKETNFYSSDSDFDDDEPKKFHVQIRPPASGSCRNSAATEQELKATVGALTLPPNRVASVKRHLSRNSTSVTGARSDGEGDPCSSQRGNEHDGYRRCASSPVPNRLISAALPPEPLFGPPLESAFKHSGFTDSKPTTSSSDSSSPENVEDSGLDSPSHQPLGPSPEPCTWAAWPAVTSQSKEAGSAGDPFLTVSREPSSSSSPRGWLPANQSPRGAGDDESSSFSSSTFAAFSRPSSSECEPPSWPGLSRTPLSKQCDPFLADFDRTPKVRGSSEPWNPNPKAPHEGRARSSAGVCPVSHGDPFAISFSTPSDTGAPVSSKPAELPLEGSPEDPFSITMLGSPTHQSSLSGSNPARSAPGPRAGRKELVRWNSLHNPFVEGSGAGRRQRAPRGAILSRRNSGTEEVLSFSVFSSLANSDFPDKEGEASSRNAGSQFRNAGPPPISRQDGPEMVVVAPPRPSRAKRAPGGRLSGCERSRSVCSSPLLEPSPPLTTTTSSSSSSSSPCEWGVHIPTPRPASPPRGLSRGPSPISLSSQDAWPVAAAITEYINAYFKGGELNRCLVKITGDLTMSFPAGITRIFNANPTAPVLSFRLVNTSRVDHFLPNQKLLYSDPSQSDPDSKDFWFNMQALTLHLQREAELNPQASYYNVGLLKYQVSSQDPGCAPLHLSARCQCSGSLTRVSLDYHCCPASPATELSNVQVVISLEDSATDVHCQPPGVWNAEEQRLLWKLHNLSPTADGKGAGTVCASWQCRDVLRGALPSVGVQFVGSGEALSGVDLELVGGRYRMSLVKKRFATGKYMAGCSI